MEHSRAQLDNIINSVRTELPVRFAAIGILLALSLISIRGATAQARDESTATVRLKPSVFTNLSSEIRKELDRRGCTVPQSYMRPEPHNVIRGHFITAKQMDVAVLCSVNKTSSILIFRGGTTSVTALAPQSDPAAGYIRAIDNASPAYILEHYKRYGGPKPPPLDHDGIDDGLDGKASGVWYWYDGRWLSLTGADLEARAVKQAFLR